MSKYFATCARGVEELTEAELHSIGVETTERTHGGVFFEGDQEALYRAHLWLRTANRILLMLRSFPVKSPDDLYDQLSRFKWETFLRPKLTFSITCTISGRNPIQLNHSHFVKLRAKDAIVDRMREKTGGRPDVNLDDADIRIVLYIRNGICTLNMDATGRSLHERGYRSSDAAAPLKETMAAAILMLSGWKPGTPLVDPMCGSGTLLAEAALMSANLAPGALRARFSFMNWPDFNETTWSGLLTEADSKRSVVPAGQLFGFDKDPDAVKQTRKTFQVLGMLPAVSLDCRRFEQFVLPDLQQTGFLVVNPPYGERLGDVEKLKPLYKNLGDTLKNKCTGWTAAVFTGSAELMKAIGLKARRKIPLWNGPIECRLLVYEVFKGNARDQKVGIVVNSDLQEAREPGISSLQADILEHATHTSHAVNKLVNICSEHWLQAGDENSLEEFCAITLLSMVEGGIIELYPDFSQSAPLSFSTAEAALAEWTEEGFEGNLRLAILATEKGKRLFQEYVTLNSES